MFADRGTPSTSWNAYDGLRDALVAKGMPKDSIRFIHEASGDDEKAKLFAACRDGRVAVIIGSTEKMGTGTNIQARAVALHHLDCPWRPADVTQREGRIIRQGNQNDDVSIFRYVTRGSFDAYMWQTVTRKAKFIEQVLTGKLDVREVDDISESVMSYAEITAVAADDMRILEKAQLDADVSKLRRSQRAWGRGVSAARARVQVAENRIGSIDHELVAASQHVAARVSTKADAFRGQVHDARSADITSTDRTDFGEALKHRLARLLAEPGLWVNPHSTTPTPLYRMTVTVGQVPFTVGIRHNEARRHDRIVKINIEGLSAVGFEFLTSELATMDGSALTQRLETRVTGLDESMQKWTEERQSLTGQREQLREMAGASWVKQEEYDTKTVRLETLVRQMSAEKLLPDTPGADIPVVDVVEQVVASDTSRPVSVDEVELRRRNRMEQHEDNVTSIGRGRPL